MTEWTIIYCYLYGSGKPQGQMTLKDTMISNKPKNVYHFGSANIITFLYILTTIDFISKLQLYPLPFCTAFKMKTQWLLYLRT